MSEQQRASPGTAVHLSIAAAIIGTCTATAAAARLPADAVLPFLRSSLRLLLSSEALFGAAPQRFEQAVVQRQKQAAHGHTQLAMDATNRGDTGGWCGGGGRLQLHYIHLNTALFSQPRACNAMIPSKLSCTAGPSRQPHLDCTAQRRPGAYHTRLPISCLPALHVPPLLPPSQACGQWDGTRAHSFRPPLPQQPHSRWMPSPAASRLGSRQGRSSSSRSRLA